MNKKAEQRALETYPNVEQPVWDESYPKTLFVRHTEQNAFIKGSPLPEDTVLFQKGVEEGRRLEKDDLALTFTIPKEHFKRLMPIKQGDVFGIENLTNKEGRR